MAQSEVENVDVPEREIRSVGWDELNWSDRLLLLMRHKGIGQTELSIRSGVSQASLSRYLHGNRAPSITKLVQLAKALGTDPNWLLGFDTLRS